MTSAPSKIRAYQLDEAVESLLDDLEVALVKRNSARSVAGMPKMKSPIVTRAKHEAAIERLTAKIEAAEKAETKVRYFRRDAQSPPAADVIDEATERALIESDEQWAAEIEATIPDEAKREYSTGVRHGFKHGHPLWIALRKQQQERRDANEAWLRMLRGADELVASGVQLFDGPPQRPPAPINAEELAGKILLAGKRRRGEADCEAPEQPKPQHVTAQAIVAAEKRWREAQEETRGPGGSFWKS